jgi:hypothetical protein
MLPEFCIKIVYIILFFIDHLNDQHFAYGLYWSTKLHWILSSTKDSVPVYYLKFAVISYSNLDGLESKLLYEITNMNSDKSMARDHRAASLQDLKKSGRSYLPNKIHSPTKD